jgi:glycosyltransferase involved in cell wall biosynthesis
VKQCLNFTVAIPTYNGGSRLPQLLERLQNQINTEYFSWEIVVVDNNSSDNTAEVIKNYQLNWGRKPDLRYVLEKQQGIAFARMRGVIEASGELVAFLDDDNLPATDWVAQAITFGKEYVKAGAWSGQIHGDFEVKPPHDFERIQAFLAIREHGDKPQLFEPNNLKLPPGAALVVRKQAWCECIPSSLFFKGRIGKSMVGGDDTEALLYLHKGGWEIWYNPEMHTYHQIPGWRFEKGYLLGLARGCGLCIYQLRLINAKKSQVPILFIRTIFGNLRRVSQHIVKYRGQLKANIIPRFELEFYVGSLISPFYYLQCYFGKILGNSKTVNPEKN